MHSKILLGPRGLVVGVLTLAVGVVSGCQSYVARPLDLPSHAAAWRGRTPGDESVQALARRLAASGERASGFDLSDGLSLDEAEVVALVYNPALRLARLRAGVAQASAEHAGLWDDPEVGIDLLRIVRGVPNPWIVGSAITLTIPISGRMAVERARAHASMRMLLDHVAEAEWQTQRDLRLAWADWSAVMLRLAETERLVESLESIMQSVLPLVDRGELLRTEAGLLAIEGAMRRSELTALRAQAAEAELDIRRLMGLSPVAEVDMIAAIPALSTPQEAVEQLAGTNLTLAKLRSEYEVAEGTLRREIRKQYPDLVIGPQVESDEGQSRIGIVGAIPIPMLNANREGIATATAEREVARGAYETAYEDAVGKIAGLRVRAEAAHQQRRELEQTLVPMVDRQVADVRRLIELGESGGVGGLVLLESLVRAHGVKMRLIDLSLDAALAEIKMRELIGPDPPKTPSETAAARDADGPASHDAAEVSR